MIQSAIADLLVQQDKPQEALALYEQALRTKQDLGDIRGVAVTQSAMAHVLMQQGKLQEALALYEQALRVTQELGDVREIAMTQANLSQLLFHQGVYHRALSIVWEAYKSLQLSGFFSDAQAIQQLLITIKGRVLGSALFDALWAQVIHQPQPAWLRDV